MAGGSFVRMLASSKQIGQIVRRLCGLLTRRPNECVGINHLAR